VIDLHTLTDGGQSALDIARRLAAFLDDAQQSLELALYDVRLTGKVADVVRGALERAPGRGVQARLVYNVDHGKRVPVPPPPRTEPSLLETLPFATKAIPGVPDLMHHKYVIRDGRTVWTGSANWTDDSWTREENVIAVVDSPGLAGRFAEDFEQLWATTNVEKSGRVASDAVDAIRPWFCPGRGEQLAHRIARALGSARRRIRIASPVITSGPILGTLAELASDARLDLAGVVDATQMREVLHQWHDNGNASWKIPALRRVLERGEFTGKRSTPYRPGSVHDYMHAKVTIADDTIFLGSYNLSHSGELNAENVLELEDAALAQTLATFIDEIRALYDPVELPPE
jgi:phosphatidylserine/phosphatidylglycerophosphate/cardiolipin synthase-like enzyme